MFSYLEGDHMDLRADLDFLKNKLKTFVEEKTIYAGSAFIQEMIQLKIYLPFFLKDCLDGTIYKTKSKRKLEEECQLLEEKKQKEIEKLKGIEADCNRLAEQSARENNQKQNTEWEINQKISQEATLAKKLEEYKRLQAQQEEINNKIQEIERKKEKRDSANAHTMHAHALYRQR